MTNIIPKSALVSLSDKTNLDLLVTFLLDRDVGIISTGGTYKAIKKITDKVIEVSEYTGHKEMMDGRVKTLHPKIHAGILARREEDTDELKALYAQDAIDFPKHLWEVLRRERNRRLTETDWMLLSDTTEMSDAWKTYRQALRDLPANQTPADVKLSNVTWPTEPT